MKKRTVAPVKSSSMSSAEAVATVRRLLRSTGFEEEDVAGNRISFGARDDDDIYEGRPNPGLLRLAREKAKELKDAIPGAQVHVEDVDEWVSLTVTLPTVPVAVAPPAPAPSRSAPTARAARTLRPGDEITFTTFTVGGSRESAAIVTWDHGKSVEARTLGGEKLRLERAGDGSLRRFI